MNEESFTNFERFFQDFVKADLQNAQRHREESDFQAASLIKQIRIRYGPMVHVEINILVPLCVGCKHSECRYFETTLPKPNVFSDSWKQDYHTIGISRKKVKEASRGLHSGGWKGPACDRCGSIIELDVKGGEGFYTRTSSVSDFYSLNRGNGRKPPEWMRKIVLSAYDGKCSGCRRTMRPDQITVDHIVPVSEGGETEMENLQPMCISCNQKKGNVAVKRVGHPSLYFPLLTPSDKLLD
ncbi:MAG: HNH endonuclease [Nitrospira sp.]